MTKIIIKVVYVVLFFMLLAGCAEKAADNKSSKTTENNLSVEAGSIKGVITVTKGSVEGIKISIKELSINSETDPEGAFSFSSVTAGTYTITIDAENGSSVSRDVTINSGVLTDMGTITIETGKVVLSSLLNPIYYSNTAVIQGSINLGPAVALKKIQNTSLNYGMLYLVGDTVLSALADEGIDDIEAIPAPFSFQQVDIDDDGSYRVEDLPAGTNFQLIYIDGTSGANLGKITLKADSITTKNVNSITPNIAAVTAKIQSLSGVPLAGATIKIHQTGQTTTADSSGMLTLSNIPVGNYTLSFSADGYVSKMLSINLDGSFSSLDTIELNDEKGSVTGSVTFEGNSNHANIIVYAKAVDGSVYTALTDVSGSYTFPALPVGTGYSIIATANGLTSAKVDDVSVEAGMTRTISSITLKPLNAATTGKLGSIIGHARFYETTGFNHAGIIASIEGTDFEAVTSRDGSFILNNISEGNYTVNFSDSNHKTYTQSVEVVAGAATKLEAVTLQAKQIIVTELESLSLDLTEDFSEWILQIEIDTLLSQNVIFTLTSSNAALLDVEVTTDNKLKLTSKPNQFGDTLITVKAETSTITDIRQFNVTVNEVNDEPEIITTSLLTDEDTVLNTTLQVNDLESSVLVFSLIADVLHGTLVFGSNGVIAYTPDNNYYGSDSFTFRVTDEDNASVEGNVTITIASVNDLPVFDPVADSSAVGNYEVSKTLVVTDPDSSNLIYDVYFLSTPARAADTTVSLEVVYHYVLTCEDTSVPPFEGYDNFDQGTIDTYDQYIADATPLGACNNTPLVSFAYDSPSPSITFTPNWVGDYEIGVSASDGDNNVTETFTITITQAWQDVDDGFFSGNFVGAVDAVMDNNITYVAYGNTNNDSKLEFMKYDGSWSFLPKTGIDSYNKSSLDLAVINSTLYLYAVSDTTPGTTSGEYPKVYSFNGSGWEIVGGGAVLEDMRLSSSGMIIDGSDIYVHASNSDGSGSWPTSDINTTIHKLSSGSWIQVAEYLTDGDIDLNRLVAVSNGEIYVMPTEDINNSFKLYNYNGTTWDLVSGADYTEDNVISVIDLSAHNGLPYISYAKEDNVSNDNYYEPYIVRYSGSGWEVLGGGALSDVNAYASFQTFYLDGVPYAFTYEDRPTYRNVTRRFVDGAWELVGPMWGNGNTISLFNNYDKPFFVYSDINSSSNNQLRMKQYADLTPSLHVAAPAKKAMLYPSQWFEFNFDRPVDSSIAFSDNIIIRDASAQTVNGDIQVKSHVVSIIPDSLLSVGETYTTGMSDIATEDGKVSSFDINYSFGVKSIEPSFSTNTASSANYDDGYYDRGADRNYTKVVVNALASQYIMRDNVTGLE